MKVGDIVRVNDLCVIERLHGTFGVVVAESFCSDYNISMLEVWINNELIRFRKGDAQLGRF